MAPTWCGGIGFGLELCRYDWIVCDSDMRNGVREWNGLVGMLAANGTRPFRTAPPMDGMRNGSGLIVVTKRGEGPVSVDRTNVAAMTVMAM